MVKAVSQLQTLLCLSLMSRQKKVLFSNNSLEAKGVISVEDQNSGSQPKQEQETVLKRLEHTMADLLLLLTAKGTTQLVL